MTWSACLRNVPSCRPRGRNGHRLAAGWPVPRSGPRAEQAPCSRTVARRARGGDGSGLTRSAGPARLGSRLDDRPKGHRFERARTLRTQQRATQSMPNPVRQDDQPIVFSADFFEANDEAAFLQLARFRQDHDISREEHTFIHGEFDPGSGRTLAACLTHASRTVNQGLPWGSVANG